MTAVLSYDSTEELQERWSSPAANLPFHPVLIAGDAQHMIIRVVPDELQAAKEFLAVHRVTVASRSVDILLVVQTEPDPDASVADLRDRFVGTQVDEARDALTKLGWTVRTGLPGGASTADHRPKRLNLVVSDQVVVDLFAG